MGKHLPRTGYELSAQPFAKFQTLALHWRLSPAVIWALKSEAKLGGWSRQQGGRKEEGQWFCGKMDTDEWTDTNWIKDQAVKLTSRDFHAIYCNHGSFLVSSWLSMRRIEEKKYRQLICITFSLDFSKTLYTSIALSQSAFGGLLQGIGEASTGKRNMLFPLMIGYVHHCTNSNPIFLYISEHICRTMRLFHRPSFHV